MMTKDDRDELEALTAGLHASEQVVDFFRKKLNEFFEFKYPQFAEVYKSTPWDGPSTIHKLFTLEEV